VAKAYDRASRFTRCDGVLVEEFVDGPEFSVEAVTWRGTTHVVAVTDKLTSGPPYYVETGHSVPAQVDETKRSMLAQVAADAVAALGIDWSGSHTEIRIGPHGPRVIELGGRLGGGFITSHLVPLATGVDIVRAVISLALGREPDLRPSLQQGAAIRFVTAATAGIVQQISGVKMAQQIPGVCAVEFYVGPGQAVAPLVDCDGRIGHVIAQAQDAQAAIERASHALAEIQVDYVPRNPRTTAQPDLAQAGHLRDGLSR
jgi:biotin carboxylase